MIDANERQNPHRLHTGQGLERLRAGAGCGSCREHIVDEKQVGRNVATTCRKGGEGGVGGQGICLALRGALLRLAAGGGAEALQGREQGEAPELPEGKG